MPISLKKSRAPDPRDYFFKNLKRDISFLDAKKLMELQVLIRSLLKKGKE